jgi:hypothetical protein
MAQVDFINYFSVLFWFFFLFIVYYFINYSFLLPIIYSSLSSRVMIYKSFLKTIKYKNINFFVRIINKNINYFFIFLIIFKNKIIHVF